MATATMKRNGVEKKTDQKVVPSTKAKTPEKQTSTVTKELAQQAVGKQPISLDERINSFEKLKGLATQRERLVSTLGNLNKFTYNQGHSSKFMLRDENGEEFITSNTNLIKLVTTELQETLSQRKLEIEKEILGFEL